MGRIIEEIGSIFIPVTDLDRSISWYETVLGFEVTVRWGLGATLKIHDKTTVLGLVRVDEVPSVRYPNIDGGETPYYEAPIIGGGGI